ncbi:MFS transporter [Sphingopyxis flava]|uniref:Major Facilitator Superfamily protein n=1 Tax=Sphingopyxis flava TaxID=1507287 RepID=A0A1T5G9P6_9SPHN|nr:MFS transporter [Sphingopyxis flava]SKC05180.1 Major Facilitator Superfamily protein [Sphingopyxis flava]
MTTTTLVTRFYYGRVIVAFSAAMQIFSIGLLFYANGVALRPWMDTFGTGRGALSAVPFACTIAISILSPFAGPIFDRYPAPRLVALSLVALAAGLFGVSVAQSVPQLIAVHATLLTVGATGAGAFAAQTLTAKWFARRRGLALALAASGSGLGGLIMPPIMAVTIEAYGWRVTYGGIATFVLLVLVPLAYLLIRNPPAMLDPIEQVETATSGHGGSGGAALALTTITILRNPVFLVTTLGRRSVIAELGGVDPLRVSWICPH